MQGDLKKHWARPDFLLMKMLASPPAACKRTKVPRVQRVKGGPLSRPGVLSRVRNQKPQHTMDDRCRCCLKH